MNTNMIIIEILWILVSLLLYCVCPFICSTGLSMAGQMCAPAHFHSHRLDTTLSFSSSLNFYFQYYKVCTRPPR